MSNSNNKNKVNYNNKSNNNKVKENAVDENKNDIIIVQPEENINDNQIKLESDNEFVEHNTVSNTNETVEIIIDENNKELDNKDIKEPECLNNTIIAQAEKEEKLVPSNNDSDLKLSTKEEDVILNKIKYYKSELNKTRNELTKAMYLGKIKKAEEELKELHKEPINSKDINNASLVSERVEETSNSRFGTRGQVVANNNLFTITF